MDSKFLQAVLEALLKLINPKLEQEIEVEKFEHDYNALQTVIAMGYQIKTIRYVNGRLEFEADIPGVGMVNPQIPVIDVSSNPTQQLEEDTGTTKLTLKEDPKYLK